MMNYFTINPYTASPHPQQVFVVENIKPLTAPPMETLITFNADGTQPKKRAGRKRKEPEVVPTNFVVDQMTLNQPPMLDNSGSFEQLSPNSSSTSDDDERAAKRRYLNNLILDLGWRGN